MRTETLHLHEHDVERLQRAGWTSGGAVSPTTQATGGAEDDDNDDGAENDIDDADDDDDDAASTPLPLLCDKDAADDDNDHDHADDGEQRAATLRYVTRLCAYTCGSPPGESDNDRDHADDRAPMTTTPMTSPMTSPRTSPMMTSPMPSPKDQLDGEIRRNDDEYNEDFFAALELVNLDNSWMRGARARAHHEA